MRDRAQKAGALRYAVANRWFPQLELDVSTSIAFGRAVRNITDIDVCAQVPDEFAGFRTLLIDCKTRRGESPISRALWQKGLMARMGAERGICILRVPRIEPDHRYTAAQFGVTLVGESEFAAFVKATTNNSSSALGAIAEIDRWDSFFSIPQRFAALEPAIRFSKAGYWMSESEAEACTRTLFLLHSLRGELDPAHPEHLAVVADVAALLMHSLARVVMKVFAAYLQPQQQSELSEALLFLLYGGRSNYDHLNRIKRLISESRARHSQQSAMANIASAGMADTASLPSTMAEAGEKEREIATATRAPEKAVAEPANSTDLSLPEWRRFVEFVRQMLDAPREVSRAPLFIREIAWASFATGVGPEDGVTKFARELAVSSPQGARFAVLGLDYLCRAARLPVEFNQILGNRMLVAQSRG